VGNGFEVLNMYDHEILVNNIKRGLTIARDQNGQALFTADEKVLSFQDPLIFRQTNWSGGHGQYDFKTEDRYFDGQSIDTTIEGKVFLGPLINVVDEDDDTDLETPPVCFAYFKAVSLPLIATTNKIYHLDAGGWDLATTVDGTVVGVTQFHEYNGVMYGARGTAGAYIYSTDGLTWVECDLVNHHANGFFTAPNPAGTQDVLWKWENPNQITNTTDGRTVAGGGIAWSSPAYIGDTTTNIQNMFMVNNYLMIGKADDMFYYDSDGGVHPIMAELDTSKSTQNFKYQANWQTGAYFSLVDGLAEITSYNAYDTVSPLTHIDDIGKLGTVIGLASDKDWLYCVMDEGTNNIIYKGREISRDATKWVWCPWVFLGTNACTCAIVIQHSLTDRRLWFGYGANTAYVKLSDNPLADSNATFAPSGFIRMSYLSGSDLHYDKIFGQPIAIETEDCAEGKTVQAKYRIDSETAMSTLTDKISTNGVIEAEIRDEIACNKIQFELDLATDASTTTPQVLFFQSKGVEKPDVIRIYHVTYAIGTMPTSKVETVRDLLRTARTSTKLIKWADLRFTPTGTTGADFEYVVMEPGYPKEVEVFKGKDKAPELGLEVAWRVIDRS